MAVFYVDEEHAKASDGNTGTESSPFLTIQRAADIAKPGDTIYVKAGTYSGFTVKSSGEEGNRIVISAYPGDEHKAIIDGTGSTARGLIMARGESHIEISGFRIQNAPTDGIFIEGSKAGSSDIVISGNQIDTTGNSGIYVAGLVMGQTIGIDEYRLFDVTISGNEVTNTNTPNGSNEAISIGGGVDGFVVRDNWVHDTLQYGIDVKLGARNGEIFDNLIDHVEKHGIYIDAASRTVENISIHNNTIHDNNNGIVLARESARSPAAPNLHDIDIFDNLVYDNAKYGIMAYKHVADTGTGIFGDVWISSNTIYGNGANGVRLVGIGDFATNFVVSGNNIYDNGVNIVNQIGASILNNSLVDLLTSGSEDGVRHFDAHYALGAGLTTADGFEFHSAGAISHGDITIKTKAVDILGTTDDALYASYGFGDDFSFAVDVPKDGVYRVELHLAEMFHTSAGKRVFDVALEGKVHDKFNDIDIIDLTGKRYTATTISETVKVTDGVLDIHAFAEVDRALLNGFSIYFDH